MFSPLHSYKVFLASLLCYVSSSAVINLIVFWYIKARSFSPSGWNSFVSPAWVVVLTNLGMGAFFGLFKSLTVIWIAFAVEPHLRWRVIAGSTAVISLIEAWFYYELWTWPIAHG